MQRKIDITPNYDALLEMFLADAKSRIQEIANSLEGGTTEDGRLEILKGIASLMVSINIAVAAIKDQDGLAKVREALVQITATACTASGAANVKAKAGRRKR